MSRTRSHLGRERETHPSLSNSRTQTEESGAEGSLWELGSGARERQVWWGVEDTAGRAGRGSRQDNPRAVWEPELQRPHFEHLIVALMRA